jgi:hypothetical protein
VGGDYHLKAGSPCIDTGNPVIITWMDLEIDDMWRAVGSAPDIGAYEFGTLPSPVSISNFQTGKVPWNSRDGGRRRARGSPAPGGWLTLPSHGERSMVMSSVSLTSAVGICCAAA